jgi:2-oxoglutarate ferredoxin oxidoreductase subunit alpha
VWTLLRHRSTVDVDSIDFADVAIDRGKTLDGGAAAEEYLRFAYSPDGVSPRAFPGDPAAIITTSSDEHEESGHISEAAEIRIPMMQKRMQKLETARQEMRLPALHGPEGADITLITWGSTHGTVRHAVDILNESGESVRMLHFSDLCHPWTRCGDAARLSSDGGGRAELHVAAASLHG